MQIKRAASRPILPEPSTVLKNRRMWLLGLFCGYSLVVFALGVYTHQSGFSFSHTGRLWKDTLLRLPRRVEAAVAAPGIDHLAIDIQHQDFMRLAYQRELALSRGVLIASNEDFVPADITIDGASYQVDIRLKGDSTDHLQDDKWSFRIRVEGDQTISGMKQFSIQHPRTRNYLYEWLFHQALRREGLVALRYDFIRVTLNGKDLGVYALEEHFEKRLIENNTAREGPIFRFNEDPRWEESYNNPVDANYLIFNSYLPVDIDSYQTGLMDQDQAIREQYLRGLYLLESFRRGVLSAEEAFDLDKLARLFALADLFGAQHSIAWANMRFYYNPITSRLEPIGFDGDSGKSISAISPNLSPLLDPNYLERLFNDLAFYERYVEALERVSQPEYLDEFLGNIQPELRERENVLYRWFPEFSFTTDVLYRNRHFIQQVLNPTRSIHAYLKGVTRESMDLEFGNLQSLPVEVLQVEIEGLGSIEPETRVILPDRPVAHVEPLLECKVRSTALVEYQVVPFKLPEGFEWDESSPPSLRVHYRLLGTAQVREQNVTPWSYLEAGFFAGDIPLQEPNAQAFAFLEIDPDSESIFFRPGTWRVNQSLILPAGWRVFARPGTRLDLTNSATILSYAPLDFSGSRENPIVLSSSDGTGQGLVVIKAGQSSTFQHVIVDGLAAPSNNGWELTGAVTFYESPVRMSQIQFLNNKAEDALNLIRSEFAIEHAVFENSAFDAIDVDFAHGRVAHATFLASGNDAIDVSGSFAELSDITIEGTGDKGISVGERSQVSIDRVVIRGALVALASKDWSSVLGRNLAIGESEHGLAVYQKKAEFGPATMEISGLEVTAISNLHLVEDGSTLVVDGLAIAPTISSVYDQIYGTGG